MEWKWIYTIGNILSTTGIAIFAGYYFSKQKKELEKFRIKLKKIFWIYIGLIVLFQIFMSILDFIEKSENELNIKIIKNQNDSIRFENQKLINLESSIISILNKINCKVDLANILTKNEYSKIITLIKTYENTYLFPISPIRKTPDSSSINELTKENEIKTTQGNEPNIKMKTTYNSEFNSYEKISFKKVMTDLYKELIKVYPPVIKKNKNWEDENDEDNEEDFEMEQKHYKIYISDFEMENGNVSKFNKLLKSKLNDDLFNSIKNKKNYTINTIMDNTVHFNLKSKIIIETKDNLRVSFLLITDNKIIASLTYDYITDSK